MPQLNLMIGFSSTHSWISRLIQWFLNSQISHTFVSVDVFNTRLIIGADEGGLNWEDVSRFKAKTQVRLVLRPKKDLTGVFETFVQRYAGVEYDWISAGIGGIKTRLRWLWKIAKRKLLSWTKPDRMNCAEVTGHLLKSGQYDFMADANLESTSAQDLLHLCLQPENVDNFEVLWIDPKLLEKYPHVKALPNSQ